MREENRLYIKGSSDPLEMAKNFFPQLIRMRLVSKEEFSKEKLTQAFEYNNIEYTEADIEETLKLCREAIKEVEFKKQ